MAIGLIGTPATVTRVSSSTTKVTSTTPSFPVSPSYLTATVMVVAGGGGAGSKSTGIGSGSGGGGGAGGFREDKSPVTPYTASPLDGAGAITVLENNMLVKVWYIILV